MKTKKKKKKKEKNRKNKNKLTEIGDVLSLQKTNYYNNITI